MTGMSFVVRTFRKYAFMIFFLGILVVSLSDRMDRDIFSLMYIAGCLPSLQHRAAGMNFVHQQELLLNCYFNYYWFLY